MYQHRFQSKQTKRLFHLKGRFALTYMGGGTFYYTLPSQRYPIVGKIELGHRRNRRRFAGFFFLSLLLFSFFSFLPNAGQAVFIASEDDLKLLESQGRFKELDQKSEEAKSRLYTLHRPISRLNSAKIKIKKYKIQAGDTLSEIAQRHGVPATIIAESSKIKYHSVLKEGQELSIPERPGLNYKLKSGDRLAAVLDKYSVKLEDFAHVNSDLPDLDMIEPGTTVFLPNAKIPRPPLRWRRPVWGRFTSRFGWRRHPILRHRHFHTGVDIAVRYKPIRAARSGRVVYAGYLGAYGKVVVIRHEGGFKTLYAHLSRIKVRSGSYVKQGQSIAISGNSGRSTGPHLHFEVVKNGRPVNPRRYIRF